MKWRRKVRAGSQTSAAASLAANITSSSSLAPVFAHVNASQLIMVVAYTRPETPRKAARNENVDNLSLDGDCKMVAYTFYASPPEPPRKAARKKQVENLSLDDDIDSIKMALQSVFEAAVELDSFLAEDRKSDSDNVAEDDSFASEELRLHASELVLRQALESIDYSSDNKGETDSVSSEAAEPLDAMCAESYESPESQVPLLQPVSPFGSPMSESSSSSSRSSVTPSKGIVSFTSTSLYSTPVVLSSPTVARIHLKESKKRQIRPYGLRPHVRDDKSFVDLEALHQLHSPKGDGSAHIMANALFGRTEYTLRPFFSSGSYTRTVQGTISVLLASGIVAADRFRDSPYVILLVIFSPLLIAFVQAKLPHTTDETTLAVIVLGTHVAMSHLSARCAF